MNLIDLRAAPAGPRADELLAGLQSAVAADERVRWNESGHARSRVGQALEDARITLAARLAELGGRLGGPHRDPVALCLGEDLARGLSSAPSVRRNDLSRERRAVARQTRVGLEVRESSVGVRSVSLATALVHGRRRAVL